MWRKNKGRRRGIGDAPLLCPAPWGRDIAMARLTGREGLWGVARQFMG